MTRSVNTTLTVLLTLFALFFFGGATLRNFAFALLVGITAGAYSSVFIATPLVVLIDEWKRKRDEQQLSERRALRESQGRSAADEAAKPERPARAAEAKVDDEEPSEYSDETSDDGARGPSSRRKPAAARRDRMARRRR